MTWRGMFAAGAALIAAEPRAQVTWRGMFAAGAALIALAPCAQAQSTSIRALELYRRGNCAEATPLLQDVLQRDSKNIAARKMLAKCLIQEGRTDDGREQYRAVLKIAPGDAEASSALVPAVAKPPAPAPKAPVKPVVHTPTERELAGRPLDEAERDVAAGKLDDAERVLVALQAAKPDLLLPRQRLAEIYIRTNQNAKAGAIFRSMAAVHNEPSYLLRAAQNYSWAQDYTDSAAAYREYLRHRPSDSEAWLGLANVLFWSEQHAGAADAFRAYLKEHPQDLDVRMNRANALLWSKQYGAAIEEFQSLNKLRPGDVQVSMGLAQAYENSTNNAEAIAGYQQVLKLDPGNKAAAESVERLSSLSLQQSGFARIEKNDPEGAARYFVDYLAKHPESNETMLQIGRVYAWAKRYPEAVRYYEPYVKRVPGDEAALREMAKVELSIPDFAAARAQYLKLANAGKASAADYEDLVHAFIWDGKYEEAQPYAKQLATLDKNSTTAFEARRLFAEQQRARTIESAQSLASAGRYPEALEVYRSYSERFSADREIELAMARIYSWDKELPKAAQSYQEYLERYPDDRQARLELADIDKWNGKYPEATAGYQSVLQSDPKNPKALMGLAELTELRNADPMEVARSYREAVVADPANTAAKEKVDQLVPQVSPSLAYTQHEFNDSDGFSRSLNVIEASIPFSGGLRITPFYRYDYFSQYRQVDGSACGATPYDNDPALAPLSQQICGKNGTVRASGGGARFDVTPSPRVGFSADLAAMSFDTSRLSFQAQGQLVIHPSADKTFMLSYTRRDAIYDVNTISSVFAGIISQTGAISYQQPISERWRIGVYGGVSRYSRGDNDVESGSDTQRRFSARLDYQVAPGLSAGYFARVSSFTELSKLYFSPSYYGVYGAAYSFDREVARNLRLTVDGDVGYGQVNRFGQTNVNQLEISFYPAILWRLRPDVSLQMGYRFGRGRSSAFNSAVYDTGAFELRLVTAFPQSTSRTDPARLEHH